MFAILARRSGDSIFGAAEALCKGKDGEVVTYETFEDADAAATLLNDRVSSPNVSYRAVPCD